MPLATMGYVFAGVAAACVIARWLQLAPRQLAANVFGQQIAKLCRADNVDRAIKLCGAAPNAPVAGMMRTGLAELAAGRDADAAARAFDEAKPAWVERVGRGRVLANASLASAVLAIVVAIYAMAGTPLVYTVGVAGLAAVVSAWSVAKEARLIADAVEAWRHEVLPVLRERK